MSVNKIQLTQSPIDKELIIPVQLTWDYLGLDQSIDEYEGQIIYDTSKPKGQVRKPTSNAKFIELGWKEEMYTPIEIGLKKTCDWFKQNYPNVRGI